MKPHLPLISLALLGGQLLAEPLSITVSKPAAPITGLKRHAAEIKQAGGLTFEILPFRADARVFLPDRPTAGSQPMLSLDAVNLAPIYQIEAD